MTGLSSEIRAIKAQVGAWWNEMDNHSKAVTFAVMAGVGVFIAGGLVLEAALTGAATNAFFWFGLVGPKQKEWLKKHGRKIGFLFLLFSIGVTPFVGPTIGMTLMFTSGFFDLGRRLMCPSDEDMSAEEAK